MTFHVTRVKSSLKWAVICITPSSFTVFLELLEFFSRKYSPLISEIVMISDCDADFKLFNSRISMQIDLWEISLAFSDHEVSRIVMKDLHDYLL